MTTLIATSHTDTRKHGITVETTEYFNKEKILVKKQLNFFNAQKELTLTNIEDVLNGTITELKPKPEKIQHTNKDIYFIKTIYNTKYYMLSQGTADKDGEYHGMVSIFKPHKTRYEEYHHGQKIADHTHPGRDKLIRLAILSAIAGGSAILLQKCEPIKNLSISQNHIRMHE
ncbi:MAG: hypothetical protein J6V11_05230 [Alphaproteobacteria bacterium]|nr:hypothetical protein [Alphaproteobacteria bacterium]